MYRRPMVTRLLVGMFTPAIRATPATPVGPARWPDVCWICPQKGRETDQTAPPPNGGAPKRRTIVPTGRESTRRYQDFASEVNESSAAGVAQAVGRGRSGGWRRLAGDGHRCREEEKKTPPSHTGKGSR